MEINKSEASIEEVVAWIENNSQGDERKFQLQSSPDLVERRKRGDYYRQALKDFNSTVPVTFSPDGEILES